jgi:hypothetical protein
MTATIAQPLARTIEKRTAQLKERFAAAGFTLLHADPASKNSNPARYPLRFVHPTLERWDLLPGRVSYHTIYLYGPEQLDAVTADPVLLGQVCALKRHKTYDGAVNMQHRPSGWSTTLSQDLATAKGLYGEAAATLFVTQQWFAGDAPEVAAAQSELARREGDLLKALAAVRAKNDLIATVAPSPAIPAEEVGRVHRLMEGYGA